MRNHKKLNNTLTQIRKSAGITQAELAEEVGVSRKSINAVENGVYIPSTVLALKIAYALKCSVHQIFFLPESLDNDLKEGILRLS